MNRKVCSGNSGNKFQVTMTVHASAKWHALPPFIIYDAKGLNYEELKGELTGIR